MEVKQCRRCNQTKDIRNFSKNSSKRDKLNTYCKSCHKVLRRKHYLTNIEKARARIREQKREVRQWLDRHKETLSCTSCGEGHPACLDFHHKDPKTKDIRISEVSRNGWGKKRILQEIDKCLVLCSNCHRKLHYTQKTGPWAPKGKRTRGSTE